VPSTNLKDRRLVHGCEMGLKAYFIYVEEELVKFLTDCSKMGYGKTKQDVMKTVEKYVVGKGLKIHERWMVDLFLSVMAPTVIKERRFICSCL